MRVSAGWILLVPLSCKGDKADTDSSSPADCDDSAIVGYADSDGDGFGDQDRPVAACEDTTSVDNDEDCDDGLTGVNPDALEYCDSVDNDCDGDTDEDALDGDTWYLDDDGDGFGDPDVETVACDRPSGYSPNDEDCDDSDEDVSPTGEEVADDQDNDCDGQIDEGVGGEGEGEGEGEGPIFSVSWSRSGVTISISGGSGTYDLGMAETDPRSPDPWTGEDCYNGYTLSSGEVLLYCHPLSRTGGSFTSGGDPVDLDEDSETVFTEDFEDVITYAVWSNSTGDCWVWGHDPDYYRGLGCEEL